MWNLLTALDNMNILILSLPVHEYWVFLHLFVFLKNFFQECVVYSAQVFFISLVKFISKYVILFDAILNAIVFLTSFL